MQDPPTIPLAEIPDAALVVGRDSSIVGANAQAERLFGYARNELAGLALDLLIPETYREGHGSLVEGFLAEPEPRLMGIGRELHGLKKDGQEFPVEIAIGPIEGASLAVAMIRDITASVLVRDDLRRREKRFHAAAASTTDLIWEADFLAQTVDWFGDIDQLLGYDPGSFPRTVGAWNELIHPDDIDEVNRRVERLVETGDDFHARYRVRHKDGTYRHWEDRARVIGWIDGRANQIVGSISDITELKRSQEEARKHREALARVDRATSLGQLTGSIAHELNQPLTGILSNAQAAELMIQSGQWEGEELAKILADIVADTKRGSEVIRNLRELYREQKGVFLPVDLDAVIDETLHLLHSELVATHVELTSDRASGLPKVEGNRIQIQQVLVNLIMNGQQSMAGLARADRRLHIATAYDEHEIMAWVDDCGPGIDADKIDRIFEPLATWKPGGTGMGLAISNSIIESHNGRMWAENQPEGGARVGFALPVLREGEPE